MSNQRDERHAMPRERARDMPIERDEGLATRIEHACIGACGERTMRHSSPTVAHRAYRRC